jgi:hypothetical protein
MVIFDEIDTHFCGALHYFMIISGLHDMVGGANPLLVAQLDSIARALGFFVIF